MASPSSTQPIPALRRARIGVAAIFALNGFLAALWVAHIPVISERTGVGHDALGGLLLVLGGAAFVGMQLCGPLIDRWGSRPLTVTTALLLCAVIVGPVLATDTVTLAVALAAFGFANGCLDVSMNAQAVVVERAYRRPIMSTFHGFFSLGSLVGSGLVALTLWARVGVVGTVVVSAVGGALLVVVTGRLLMPPRADRRRAEPESSASAVPVPAAWWRELDLRRLGLLAAVAFSLMLAEGTAYDWSALYVVETFDTPEALGAIAFGAFSATMTTTRFVVDRVVARIGAVALVRLGASLGIGGMLVAILAPVAWVAIIGWAVFGIGLAGLIPQIFTAAGNLTSGAGGRSISVVVGFGYLGLLAGPALVGFIGGRAGLGVGLIVAIVTLVFAVSVAGVVRPARARHPSG